MKKRFLEGQVYSMALVRLCLALFFLMLVYFLAGYRIKNGDPSAESWAETMRTGMHDNIWGEGEKERIILTYGSDKFEYTLDELSLELLDESLETGFSDRRFMYCLDHSVLRRQLFQLSEKIRKEAKEACLYVDASGVVQVTTEQEGRELDMASLLTILGQPGFYQEYIELPVKRVYPRVTAEELKGKMPQHLWSQYSTVLVNIPERTENVGVACNSLDGLLIAPGEEVSFNKVVGPRTLERGYRVAKVIAAGRFEPGLGGGVCQVSSTLYNTVLLAGLEIRERHNHSIFVSYVPLGQDATVLYGHKDFIFRNNTEDYLLLRTKLQGLRLTISLFGSNEKPYSKVSVENKVIKVFMPSEIIVSDSVLPGKKQIIIEKGQKGYLVETYRLISREDYEKRELLSRDYYASVSALVTAAGAEEKEDTTITVP